MSTEVEGKKKKGKKSVVKRIFLVLSIVILLILGGIASAIWLVNARYYHYSLDFENLRISENEVHSNRVRNIAVFGVDGIGARNFSGLSDTIMVVSLDYDSGEIRLVSFMRDSLVRIDRPNGSSVFTRQNHAYSYGGPELAIRTLNTNYDLDIQDFMTINFSGFETIIDRIGGITVDVRNYEVWEINRVIREMNNEHGGRHSRQLAGSGLQTLNGRQALAYSRIRAVGDGDAGRTDRNRIVMEQIIENLFTLSHTDLVALAWDFMPYVRTSFSIEDIIDTVTDYNIFRNASISQFRYPVEYRNSSIRGMSIVRPTTLESNVIKMMEFIYGIENYEVSDAVREISEAIERL